MSDFDIINCDYNDPNVWDMIGEGRVKGCFQIESFLGKNWCKKIKPKSINELSDLISLIRPGCLSMAQIYLDRRDKKIEVTSLHPLIDDILKETFGVIVYQEQSMMIAQKLARFTLEQADDLRKAIGKKKADLMKKVRTQFIEGCVANNVPESKAIEIFDIIELSNRYSFNKCLDPTTIVETQDGYKMLSEVQIGDKVLAPKNMSEDHYVEVVNKYDNGEKEVYEIELENGASIRCTLDHEFLCEDGQKHKLSDIIENNLSIMVYNY